MKNMMLSTLMLMTLSVVSCSDDNFAGDAPKDWANTTERFVTAEEQGLSTYYTPAIGRVGDPMPFYDEKAGEFKVMYLQEFNNNKPFCYHPFWTVATTDGANYRSLGETLAVGTSDYQPDAALGTGCCYYSKADNLYYIYYTGHNPNCTDVEVVMRATSPDFKTWTRDNSWTLRGKDYGFSSVDFRDPQIFEDGGVYNMVITTRRGDPKFAHFTSTDMKDWTFAGEFNAVWDRMCECPDIFKMGDYWYCIYSEAYLSTWSRKVKYMMADSFEGLKRCFADPGANWPRDDKEGVLDSRAFYAGKTASNGTDRYIWGWCPYRSGKDIDEMNINVGEKEPNWSGALVCHKLIQHADGTLSIGEVEGIKAKYNVPAELKVMESNGYAGNTLSGAGAYVLYNRLGAHNHISFTAKASSDDTRFGVSLCRSTDVKKYYSLIVNPEWANGRRKINFEQEGEGGKGFIEGADGYIFPRPADNVYNVDIYTDNSVVTMYINGVYGYTQRIYGTQKNCWSINCYNGQIEISNLSLTQY